MDRFDAMRTLLAAVDRGSLSAASRALGMSLPTVSRKISELEDHLRTRLLVRTSRRLMLTDAGRAFVDASRRLLEDLDSAERAASGEYQAPRGDLLVTAPIMFGRLHVVPVVAAFLAAYPEVNVRVALFDHVIDLVENHIDVAVRIGRLPDSGLVAMRVGEVRWVICASPDYLSRRGTPETPAELKGHDCLSLEGLQPERTWPFVIGHEAADTRIRPRFSVNTAEALIEAAAGGLGIARLMSYHIKRRTRYARVGLSRCWRTMPRRRCLSISCMPGRRCCR